MSVDDLVYKLFTPEMYEFRIDGVIYGKQNDIPVNILGRNVDSWEVKTNTTFFNLYCLNIETWDYVHRRVVNEVLQVGFAMEQVKKMLHSGMSLSNITDMTLEIDAVVNAYTGLKYNKHNIRHIIYEIYANELLEDVNNLILGN